MTGWLSRIFAPSARRPPREALLNDGLELALDWGENWLSPIQARLQRQHAYLRREELDELNAVSQAALKLGHETAYALAREKGKEATPADFLPRVRAAHPWINAANGARLFNQSMYFVWKTGGPAV